MMGIMDHYLDIIIFAVIAVVLLLRLRSVLGSHSEDGPPPLVLNAQKEQVQDASDGAPPMPQDLQRLPERWTQNLPNFDLVETATVHNNLVRFVAIDPTFRPDDFLNKATKAYLMIVGGFATGNRGTLQLLLSPKLYQEFLQQIEARERSGERYDIQNTLKKAVISGAELDGTQARVEVSFTAEHSVTHQDAEGRYIDGQTGQRHVARDRWVFTKDLKDPSPSWLLADTLEFADI